MSKWMRYEMKAEFNGCRHEIIFLLFEQMIIGRIVQLRTIRLFNTVMNSFENDICSNYTNINIECILIWKQKNIYKVIVATFCKDKWKFIKYTIVFILTDGKAVLFGEKLYHLWKCASRKSSYLRNSFGIIHNETNFDLGVVLHKKFRRNSIKIFSFRKEKDKSVDKDFPKLVSSIKLTPFDTEFQLGMK